MKTQNSWLGSCWAYFSIHFHEVIWEYIPMARWASRCILRKKILEPVVQAMTSCSPHKAATRWMDLGYRPGGNLRKKSLKQLPTKPWLHAHHTRWMELGYRPRENWEKILEPVFKPWLQAHHTKVDGFVIQTGIQIITTLQVVLFYLIH